MSEAYMQIEQFKPVRVKEKKMDEVKGTQHTQTGNEDKSNEVQGIQHLRYEVKKNPCFKCDLFKPDLHGNRNYKFTSKAEGLVINNQ